MDPETQTAILAAAILGSGAMVASALRHFASRLDNASRLLGLIEERLGKSSDRVSNEIEGLRPPLETIESYVRWKEGQEGRSFFGEKLLRKLNQGDLDE